MMILYSLIVCLVSSPILTAHAIPLVARAYTGQQVNNNQATYSVVAVDGDATVTQVEASPTTIIETAVRTVTVTPIDLYPTATVLVTVTQSPSSTVSSTSRAIVVVNPERTTTYTVSTTSTTTPSASPPVSALAPATAPAPAATNPYRTTSATLSRTSLVVTSTRSTVPTSTNVYLRSTSSTRTYDNGMWHTTYPPWNATMTTTLAAST
jgi:hypothetical protein